ncbi:MAG: DUF4238 domain-containing protein [Xanthobacteraceae bacterium]
MSQPRDHHFLPVFYLNQWAVKGGKLVEYSIKKGKLIPKPVGPGGTGFQRDLYAFPELQPEESQHIERVFFDYADRVASDALQKHLTGDKTPWTAELRSAWSRFVIGIHLRHPDAIAELRVATKAAWDANHGPSQTAYEELRKPEDPATFEEYIEKHFPLTPIKAFLNMIIKVIDNQNLGTHINHMIWGVADLSRAGIPLLTSDRPVEISRLKENGIISIPISPTQLFIAAERRETLASIAQSDPKEVVKSVNKYVTSRARRFVYAPDEKQTTFVEKHMSQGMEPTPLFPNTSKIGQPGFIPSSSPFGSP